MDIKDLENKTVAQLKEIAKELGITGISGMKKADLVTAVSGAQAAPAKQEEPAAETPVEAPAEPEVETAVEAASAAEPEPETALVEAQAEPEVETAVEAAPAAETEPETAPVEVAVPSAATEPAPADAETPPAKAAEPKAKKPEPAVQPQSRIKRKLLARHDIPSLKKEKKALKGQIAQAVETKDFAKIRELRNRKKELRRILNRAS